MEQQQGTASDATNQGGKILSICWNAGALAASYFDFDQLELYVVQQAIEPRPQYVLLRELLRRYPALFYIVSGAACFLDDCHELLRVPSASETASDPNDTTAGQGSNFRIYEFNPRSQSKTRARLLALRLPTMPRDADERECQTFLESILPFEQELLVHCVGNLLLVLDGVGESLSPNGLVTKINLITPSTQLIIDGLTYDALQIFDASRHPSGFKCGTERRGMSVYSLFNKCASRYGEEWLSRLMTQPIRDREELNHRYDTVQWLLANIRTANQFEQCLKHLSSLGLLYRRILQRTARNDDWKMLKKNLYYLYSLCKACAQTLEDPPGPVGTTIENLGRYIRNPANGLKHVLYTIDKCLDLERGAEENKVVVRAGLEQPIDQLRTQYEGLRQLVLETSRLEMETLRIDMTNVCVTYLPSFGFVISTQVDERLQRSGIFSNASFDLVFQADDTAYFQINLCKELNTEYGVMMGKLIEYELAFQNRITSFVGHKFPELMAVFKDAGKLDALLSFATVAKMYRYVRPTIGDGKVLQIRTGRNLLLEHRKAYHPNDTDVGGTHTHLVNVIAADSSVGKTTYLKELATICYLAHVGSFVPAAYAMIPLLDSIYTRLDHPESIFSGKSSFMSELHQMANVLQNATSRSLVLIDEFGKGTGYVEGKSLLIASIEHLLKRNAEAPITFVATKFVAIGEFLPVDHQFLRVFLGRPESRETSRNISTDDTLHVTDTSGVTELLETTYRLASRAVAFALIKHYQTAGQLPGSETVRSLMDVTPITRVAERCIEISRSAENCNRHGNDDVDDA